MAYRILHLLYSDQRRGAEVFASQLARCMEERGRFKNGICVLFSGGGTLVEGLPVFKLEPREELLDKNSGVAIGVLLKLYTVLRRFRPDVIIAHGSSTLKYSALVKLLYPRAPTIYRNIGTASIWAETGVKIRLNKLLLKGINTVVSVSQHTKRDFVSLYHFPSARVRFISNGVDVSEFDRCSLGMDKHQAQGALGLSGSGLVLITVGNLSPEKGHGGLLSVIANLRNSGLDVQLLLVGDGPLRQELERWARELGIAGDVHFLGTRNDVPKLLAAADIFVLPSQTEGMPAALIEAGLARLASVAFDVGGVSEVVEEQVTGLLVPAENFDQMFQAIMTLCGEQRRRTSMGEAAYRRCREMFDIRQVAREYEELCTSLLEGVQRHHDIDPAIEPSLKN